MQYKPYAMHKQPHEQASSQASMGVSMGRGQSAHHETVALAALDRRSFLTSASGAATLHTQQSSVSLGLLDRSHDSTTPWDKTK